MTREAASKRALLIAYHYPPLAVSSGLQRTLAFSRYLREYGWDPLVLTVHPRAYEAVREDQLDDIPAGIELRRAFALDIRRHLSIADRYPAWLAVPDRWASWFPGGVIAGLRLIRRYRPAAIWSTFPIATAHLIALALHRISGLPWLADLRDPMTEPGYRDKPGHLWLERRVIRHADCVSFTSPGTLEMYAERYPAQPRGRWFELPNGYDEEIFASVEQQVGDGSFGGRSGPLLLVHSGLLYPDERDPRPFFAALARLKAEGAVGADNLRIVLRATGHDETYAAALAELGVADLVELTGPVPYRAALREMLEADGLLIFQAASCNIQTPAKVYEYLRARRPIFALTDAAGDTAAVLREAGLDTIVPLDDPSEIASGLGHFLARVRAGKAPVPVEEVVLSYSRRALTAQLAQRLDAMTRRIAGSAATRQTS